ncbi:uncharacterized protein N7459_010008 [Penicillium hispanicum]|uniref:uncharacterized protein n=1 Tax=Penicillium hispanicum TaxID=1080232 RepID=UPI002541BE28|nr:uncharacterized protein N7459_010008 [Penicillium hispanicum]KAJ5570578.1 hypothetical protein N7459_010008 [Penicillium hispanicum]
MVYRGKPGLGCALCRKRRLACDRRRPSCSQCLRVNQECSGYRDPNALRIHDHTQELAVKAQARRAGASKVNAAEQSTSTVSLRPPPMSIDERAMSYTFTYYVGTAQNHGVLFYVLDLLHTCPSPALQATTKAVGLASICRIQNSPELKRIAGEEYSTALLTTNEALKESVSAKSDSTLAAILSLGMYEIITCQASDLMRTWSNHAKGAMKLLELRGVEQLSSPTGLELFTIVRLQNAISNVFFRLPGFNTPGLATLSKVARAKHDVYTLPIEEFYQVLIELNGLAVEVDAAELEDDPAESLRLLIGKALYLDANLRSWAMSLSPAWRYTVIDDPCSHLGDNTGFPVYGGRRHLYQRVTFVSMWNHYRQLRIIVNEMIRSMSLRLWKAQRPPECQQTVSQSIAIINQMADDLCTSISYYFTSDQTSFGAALRLLWPLFVAANCAGTDPATKEWILQALNIIGSTTGIQQAIGMSQLLRKGNILGMIPGTRKGVNI